VSEYDIAAASDQNSSGNSHEAGCCNTLQRTATPCNALQHPAIATRSCSVTGEGCTQRRLTSHTATHCNTLHHTTTPCHTLQQRFDLAVLQWRGIFSVLQCVAVCCIVLQSYSEVVFSVCCSVLQCVASVLQCVAVCCNVLQCVAVVQWRGIFSVLQCVAVCCSVLQCVAVCCSVLQCVAVC